VIPYHTQSHAPHTHLLPPIHSIAA
jgi:hypothetical protein